MVFLFISNSEIFHLSGLWSFNIFSSIIVDKGGIKMNILKKICLIGLCAFSVIFLWRCTHAISLCLSNISRGYELIEGTWQGRDGSIMSITDRGFGKAPYSVRSVSNDGNYTVVTDDVNGGRSINTLTFDNNNLIT